MAGRADNTLLGSDLEAGNMVVEQRQCLAGADSAGIAVGLCVPPGPR